MPSNRRKVGKEGLRMISSARHAPRKLIGYAEEGTSGHCLRFTSYQAEEAQQLMTALLRRYHPEESDVSDRLIAPLAEWLPSSRQFARWLSGSRQLEFAEWLSGSRQYDRAAHSERIEESSRCLDRALATGELHATILLEWPTNCFLTPSCFPGMDEHLVALLLKTLLSEHGKVGQDSDPEPVDGLKKLLENQLTVVSYSGLRHRVGLCRDFAEFLRMSGGIKELVTGSITEQGSRKCSCQDTRQDTRYQWRRDENLIDPVFGPVLDWVNTTKPIGYGLHYRNWPN